MEDDLLEYDDALRLLFSKLTPDRQDRARAYLYIRMEELWADQEEETKGLSRKRGRKRR